MNEIYFVEYSPVQNNFHIEPVESALAKNRIGILNGGKPNHVPIGFAVSYEDAEMQIVEFRKKLASAPDLRLAE